MNDRERADVRTAYCPLIEGLTGKRGSTSYEEWLAAVDRVFPPSASTDLSTRTIAKTEPLQEPRHGR